MKMVGKLKNQFFVNTHTTGTGYKGLLQIHTLAPARKQIKDTHASGASILYTNTAIRVSTYISNYIIKSLKRT